MRLLLALLLTASASAQAPRNVVVILADDMGLASLHHANPGNGLPTPHLDQLAEQGMSFTDAHSPSAVCSPTRYALLTGRYAWRTRMKSGIVNKWEGPLIADERVTIADVALRAGLRTSCIGKWHLGWKWPTSDGEWTRDPAKIDYSKPLGGGPMAAGFERSYGDDVPNWPPYVWIEDGKALSVPTERMEEDGANGVRAGPMTPGWSLDAVLPELTKRCVETIRDHARAEEPFFLFFSMTSPHTPINPSPAFQGVSGVSPYADFLLETDWSVGQVLRALDQFGVAEDTLVIFTADNGTSPKGDFPKLAEGGVDLRGPWRGHKADIWEGGHRVPFLVRWPGVVEPGSSCDTPIVLNDIFATVAAVLDVDVAHEDGVDLSPAWSGTLERGPVVHHSSIGRFAIRAGKWKAIFSPGSGGWSSPKDGEARKQGLPEVQLYDMEADPSETTNLAEARPEDVERLRQLLRELVEKDGPAKWSQLPW